MMAEEDPKTTQEELAFIHVEPEASSGNVGEKTASTATAAGAKNSDKEALYVAKLGYKDSGSAF